MKELFLKMADALKNGEDVVLVSVIASSGSTPRGIGARMLVGASGRICGTIGGGAVEYRSELLAIEALKSSSSYTHSFSLTQDDVQKLGMICGGGVTVFFQYIRADASRLDAALEGAAFFNGAEDVWMITELAEGGSFGFYSKSRGFVGIPAIPDAEPLMTSHPIWSAADGREIYVEQLVFSGSVYIFGGGHVAQELVPVISHVGFRCVVLEDRAEFLGSDLFPDAFDTRLTDFGDIFKTVSIGPEDYVIIMTRGHASDYIIEEQTLRTRARYIGVIGSAHKIKDVNARLRAAGVSESDIARVTTPIGLSIKAETPAEIAISIAGQLIAVRAAGREAARADG